MASKQLKAKAEQGYRTEPQNCGNCAHKTSEVKLPEWMIKRNEERAADAEAGRSSYGREYTVERDGIERNVRCGIGGFAVKKTATCNSWTAKAP